MEREDFYPGDMYEVVDGKYNGDIVEVVEWDRDWDIDDEDGELKTAFEAEEKKVPCYNPRYPNIRYTWFLPSQLSPT